GTGNPAPAGSNGPHCRSGSSVLRLGDAIGRGLRVGRTSNGWPGRSAGQRPFRRQHGSYARTGAATSRPGCISFSFHAPPRRGAFSGGHGPPTPVGGPPDHKPTWVALAPAARHLV